MGIGATVVSLVVGMARVLIRGSKPMAVSAAPGPAAPVDPERLKAHVRMLSETLHPRSHAHTENLERAADYIAGHLEGAGGKVESQPFRVSGREYRNVLARFGPEGGERIVIGAHYDATPGTPGADDNASGVASLLELAVLLGREPPPMRVDLVAYSLEEPPYFGSSQMGSAVHARSLKEAGVAVRGMVSLEMLGTFSDAPDSQDYPMAVMRLRYPNQGNFIGVVGRPPDSALVDSVAAGMRASSPLPVETLAAPRGVTGVDLSDHASFWDVGYPAVMITDTAFLRNPRYHTAGDTWDTLDYVRMAQVVQGVYGAVRTLAGAPSPPE
jgi:hypothetical protein